MVTISMNKRERKRLAAMSQVDRAAIYRSDRELAWSPVRSEPTRPRKPAPRRSGPTKPSQRQKPSRSHPW